MFIAYEWWWWLLTTLRGLNALKHVLKPSAGIINFQLVFRRFATAIAWKMWTQSVSASFANSKVTCHRRALLRMSLKTSRLFSHKSMFCSPRSLVKAQWTPIDWLLINIRRSFSALGCAWNSHYSACVFATTCVVSSIQANYFRRFLLSADLLQLYNGPSSVDSLVEKSVWLKLATNSDDWALNRKIN